MIDVGLFVVCGAINFGIKMAGWLCKGLVFSWKKYMTITYYLLVLSPYIYTIFASIVVQIVREYKKPKFNLINYLKSYIYLAPSFILSILSICIVPFKEYDVLPPIAFSFVLPIIFSLILLWGLYDASKPRAENSEKDDRDHYHN